MYIYEQNKVGHRYFQRLPSSQGGSVFGQVRRGDAVQTAFTSGRAGWHGRGDSILRSPAGGLPLPPGRVPAAGREMVLLHVLRNGVALRVRRWSCSVGQEMELLCGREMVLLCGLGDGVALQIGRLHRSAGCRCVSARRTAPFQPRGWVRTATCALQPGTWLGKGLSREGSGGWKVSFGAHGFAPGSALFMYEQC